MKRTMFGDAVTTAADTAQRTPIGRIGHSNDCFLDGNDDSGTYRADEPDDGRTYPPPNDRAYLAQETRLVPMGGETCREVEPPRGDCPNALTELATYHWSFLNRDWGTWLIPAWASCIKQVQNRLGYRFALAWTKSTATVRRGGTLPLRMLIRNRGWAGTVNRRPVDLVMLKINRPRSR
jgi:hypothetical protein